MEAYLRRQALVPRNVKVGSSYNLVVLHGLSCFNVTNDPNALEELWHGELLRKVRTVRTVNVELRSVDGDFLSVEALGKHTYTHHEMKRNVYHSLVLNRYPPSPLPSPSPFIQAFI